MRKIPRWLARMPVPLFKAGFGALFGGRLLMLEHIGRVTGLRRYVVLEVVQREQDGVVVASGYGWQAQWLRNVHAAPGVRLWWRRLHGAESHAQIIEAAEARELLERYRKEHPGLARFVASALGLPELTRAEPLPRDIGGRVPLVRLRLS